MSLSFDLWLEIFKRCPISEYKIIARLNKNFSGLLRSTKFWIIKAQYDLLPWHQLSLKQVQDDFTFYSGIDTMTNVKAYHYVLANYNVFTPFSTEFISGFSNYVGYWSIFEDRPENIRKRDRNQPLCVPNYLSGIKKI